MDRAGAYREVRLRLADTLARSDDPLDAACGLLQTQLPHFFWVGIYLVAADGSLRLGPYRGPAACEMLPAGRGVCGEAVARRQTVIVPDVEAHRDHIACDGRSRSEIVVPLMAGDRVIGVLDVDSKALDDFGESDRVELEAVAAQLAAVYSHEDTKKPGPGIAPGPGDESRRP
jgi:GAF domain-containing protein